MNRRDAIKLAGVAAMITAVGAEAKMAEEHFNRTEMKPKDPKKLEKGELKHTPQITLKEKDANGIHL